MINTSAEMFRGSRENRSDQDASAVRTSRDNHLPTLAHPAQRCAEFGKPAESALSKKRRNRRAKYLPRGGTPASVRFQGFGFGHSARGLRISHHAPRQSIEPTTAEIKSSTVILISPRTRSMPNSQNTRDDDARAGRGDAQNPKPCLLKVTSRSASVAGKRADDKPDDDFADRHVRMVLGGNVSTIIPPMSEVCPFARAQT